MAPIRLHTTAHTQFKLAELGVRLSERMMLLICAAHYSRENMLVYDSCTSVDSSLMDEDRRYQSSLCEVRILLSCGAVFCSEK